MEHAPAAVTLEQVTLEVDVATFDVQAAPVDHEAAVVVRDVAHRRPLSNESSTTSLYIRTQFSDGSRACKQKGLMGDKIMQARIA